MGERKAKQHSRQRYLSHNPFCCYCGAKAETVDHIPSRNYFLGRHWPEGFEFPACTSCNAETRIDEQVVAFLLNLSVIDNGPAVEERLRKSLVAIANNARDILREWRVDIPLSGVRRKLAFREAFGPLGDELRRQNWGMINIGPLTRQAVDRFITKLGKALFYRHTGRILDGYIFPTWHNVYYDPLDALQQRLRNLQTFAKGLVIPQRAKKSLSDQFFYRYNCDSDRGWLFAAVIFSEQMMFDLLVLTEPALEWVLDTAGHAQTKTEYEFARHRLKIRTKETEGIFPHTDFGRGR